MRRTFGSLAAIALAVAFAFAALASPAAAKTVWLCKPGKASDPCNVPLRTTQLSPTGQQLGVENIKRAKHPKIDCFYVYPTVSDQSTPNANLQIDPEERSIALYQAARYSEECRVFAPMYRQVTLSALFGGNPITAHMGKVAYSGVLHAWRTYLRKYNHGRGVVLIGHSQGTFVLRQLIGDEIDPSRKLRSRLVSALLLGGNVTVEQGKDSGGDFRHVGACRSRQQLGCVIAFSTFNAAVPSDAVFGRTTEPGLEVLCTNPARLGGGTAKLDSVLPSEPFAPGTGIGAALGAVGLPPVTVTTPWYEYDGAYKGRCSSADDANVLQLTDAPGAAHLNAVPDSTWGLHLADANIALGDLVDLVKSEAKAYARR